MPESFPLSLGEALRWLRTELDGPLRDEAEPLLLGVLGLGRNVLFSRPESPLTGADAARLREAVDRLRGGEPLAYVLGRQGFWSFELEVGPAVLIPRPDTEVLVQGALQRLPLDRAATVADLGTGSGAVALALAAERPQDRVLAVDCSLEALAVARRNAARHGLERIEFIAGDWLAPVNMQFDLIASNPPYLAEDDPHLGRDGLDREPRGALVSGADGLDAIRRLAVEARGALVPGGWLLLEHGWEQGQAVREVLHAAGFSDVLTLPDLAGRERVSGGRTGWKSARPNRARQQP
ncbi:peptide chain release factor N(5)-glutamine methyltransferase [Pseudomarimonas salicorniae]|uniref:Release factor glutamine methyltransferase n=1 Tax=Pseudomarimonas salicorniae TaxID=2933270 RepID=A0ABT0GI26_9GAMM|nr:peptide chain release factor N(5)-glutamine methyltransferase [Lysobacter sp. CAU 1642]MCK7593682.1 peptide chain release factor N(5)-glutamine methyltransferase [Lysobacter sp. CAU 1642]